MRNILFTLASEKAFNSHIIRKVIGQTKPINTHIIVSLTEELSHYQSLGTCYLRDNVARGIYQPEEINMLQCHPLDDKVFTYMNPHSLEIMNQQRRFEEYHAFHIAPTLESHYTIYMHNLFFWHNMLEQNNITHVFFSCVPHEGYDLIIYYLAKMKGIEIQMVYNSTFPFREYPLTDFLNVEEGLKERYAQLCEEYRDVEAEEIPLEEEADKMYTKWSSLDPMQMTPWYMKGNPLKRRFKTRFGETNLYVCFKEILRPYYKKDGLSMAFVGQCLKSISKLIKEIGIVYKRWNYARPVWKRTIKLNRFYESIAELPKEEQYIYFALHYQPEASSGPLGGDVYTDQMFALNILSQSIPAGMKVYVKVHPEQLAPLRSREYYLDMKRIPNVRLLKTTCKTFELMQRAFAVASLTGTACWEAQFFDKPAILFGYSQKNLAPLSYFVRTNEDCQKAIERILCNPKVTDLKELKLFSKAMYDTSYSVRDREEILPEIITQFIEGQPITIKQRGKVEKDEYNYDRK